MPPARFLRKQADLLEVAPSIIAPALGTFLGARLFRHTLPEYEDVGKLLGAVSGGLAGHALGEKIENSQAAQEAASQIPLGAPYQIDPTSPEPPKWAVPGADVLKTASQLRDILGGDLGGSFYDVYEGVRQDLPATQIAKNVLGHGAGIVGGGLLGHAAGGLLDRAVGHEIMGPLGVPLSTLLAGLGATIGSVKGLELAKK